MKFRLHASVLIGLVFLLLLCWGAAPGVAQSDEENALILGISDGMRKMIAVQTVALWMVADAHLEAGRTESARQKYLEAYDIQLRAGGSYGIAIAAFEIGEYYRKIEMPGEAVGWYEKALLSWMRVSNPESRIFELNVHESLGWTFSTLGRESDAIDTWEDGVALAKDIFPIIGSSVYFIEEGILPLLQSIAGKMSLRLALHYQELADGLQGGTPLAIEACSKSVGYFEKAGSWLSATEATDDVELIRTFENVVAWKLGDMHNLAEQYSLAIDAYQHALQTLRRHLENGTDSEGLLLLLIGRCYHDLGDDDSAIEPLISGAEICVKVSCAVTAGLAKDYMMLANLLHDAGRFEEASYWSGVAADAFEILSDLRGMGLSKYLEGTALRNAQRYSDAIPCLQESADILEDEGDLEGVYQQTLELLTYCRSYVAYERDESGRLRVATACMTSDVGEDNYPLDEGRSFSTSDEKAVCWVAFDGTHREETLRFIFIAPNGFVYNEGIVQAEWNRHWYWIWIKGYDAAMKTGTWTVKVYIDDQLEAEMHFNLQSS